MARPALIVHVADPLEPAVACVLYACVPVLGVTTALSEPLTLDALGNRYSGSPLHLALLSAGYYINAAPGFNGLTVLMLPRRGAVSAAASGSSIAAPRHCSCALVV